jgi:hypothetical protein
MSHRRKRVNAAAARKPSWRDILPIHPAAELFPLMTPAELRELSEDIKTNGLQTPIMVMAEKCGDEWTYQLLDGRNRLDAIELAGFDPISPPRYKGKTEFRREGRDCGLKLFLGVSDTTYRTYVGIKFESGLDDPYAYVISANIHRRHLNVEQRQHLLITLIARAPEKSDRQLGKQIGVDHRTVASARAKGETTGEISPVEKRVGKDGKARKPPAQKVKQTVTSAPIAHLATAPINGAGADSASEFARLQARNAELEIRVKELEAENAALRAQLEAAQKVTVVASSESAAAASSEITSANTVAAGDPGPFPAILLRKPKATGASDSMKEVMP